MKLPYGIEHKFLLVKGQEVKYELPGMQLEFIKDRKYKWQCLIDSFILERQLMEISTRCFYSFSSKSWDHPQVLSLSHSPYLIFCQ